MSRVLVLLAVAMFGCTPQPRPIPASSPSGKVKVQSEQEQGARYLRDPARAAQASGASELKILNFGAATLGDRVEGLVFVPQNTCALFLARATDGVEDLDLHLYGDDGTQFGVDESPDDLPTLLLCPEQPTRLFASARVAQGHGLVALGVQTVRPRAASAVAKSVGARNFSNEARKLNEPWPGLSRSMRERRQDLGGRWIDRRRVALPVDARVPTHLTVEVPKQRCVDALFLPGPDLSQLQVSALDAQGRVFVRAQARGRERSLVLCAAKHSQMVTLDIRPYAGRGLTVAAVSVSEGPPEHLDPDPEVHLHHLDSTSEPPELDTLPPPTRHHMLTGTRGQITSWEFPLKGCSRLDLSPAKELLDYSVELWNQQGTLIGQAQGRGARTLFACASGPVRLDLEPRGRSGKLRIDFRDAQAPPGALDLPLATGRLLAEGREAGLIAKPEDAGRMNRVDLRDTKLTRIPLSIPAAHCRTLFVAGGHKTWGLEGRALETKTGLELDRAYGRHSLTLRACAPHGGHLDAQIELRTTTGSSPGLWASHQHRLKP